MLFDEAIKVRWLFDKYGKDIYLNASDQINSVVEKALLEKKQRYSGKSYLEQLEKNVVYLSEGSTQVQIGIIEYLINGQPILNPDDIFSFVRGKGMSHQTAQYHWEFVQNGCKGCPVHDQHGNYERLRNFRLSGDWADYLEELKYLYTYNQTTFMVSQNFFIGFLHNQQLAGCASHILQQEVVDALIHGIGIWTNVCLGYIEYGDDLVQRQALQSHQDFLAEQNPHTHEQKKRDVPYKSVVSYAFREVFDESEYIILCENYLWDDVMRDKTRKWTNFINAHSDDFVFVITGSSISCKNDHKECYVEDEEYLIILVPKNIWESKSSTAWELNQEWEEINSRCKLHS